MKKIVYIFLLIAFIIPSVFADGDISVIVDNETVSFDQPPVIRDNYTLVPFRAIFEKLGMEVKWIQDERCVLAENSDTNIQLYIDNTIMYVNGDETMLMTPPIIVNDRTLVPLRAVSEAAGADVQWNGNTRTVFITMNKAQDEITSYLENNNNSEWGYEVLRLTNIERQKKGLNPLKHDNTLSLLALMHCEDMMSRNFFDHVNPDGEDPFYRMKEFGINYWAAGENIAAGQTSPEEAVKAWMNSKDHRENILNPKFKSMGIAVLDGGQYGNYWVQEFALLK